MARSRTASDPQASAAAVRDRIVGTAYDLFCRSSMGSVGIDRIIAEASVAKMSLYKHFRSKEELEVAVVERREEIWTRGWLQRRIKRHGSSASEQLLAIFDAYGEWFATTDYEGCLFIHGMLEAHDRQRPVGAACAAKLENLQSLVRDLADEAHVRDPDAFAAQWALLMAGSIVCASRGDRQAADRARDLALLLAEREGLVS